MSRGSDSRRLRDVTANDDEAFTAFVHATGTRLHRAAVLLTGDEHAAEDLVQATYAKVYVRWGRVRRADSPVAYAHTMLTNTFLSHRRLRRSTERTGRGADVGESLSTRAAPSRSDSDPRARESRVDLLAALRTLPPRDRAIVVLRYWEDRTVAETADAVGISEANVRSRASRALARLRPLLDDDPSPSPARTTTRNQR